MYPMYPVTEFGRDLYLIPASPVTLSCSATPNLELPQEIWEDIIDFLWDDHLALQSASLTCRAFSIRARYKLTKAHAVWLRSPEELDAIQRGLQNSPNASSFIMTAFVETAMWNPRHQFQGQKWIERLSHELPLRLSNLRNLVLQGTLHTPKLHRWALIHLSSLHNLTNLALYRCTFNTFMELIRFILSFTNLHMLVLQVVEWKQKAIRQEVMRPWRFQTFKLEKFRIYADPEELRLIVDWFTSTMSTQTLTQLEMHHYTPDQNLSWHKLLGSCSSDAMEWIYVGVYPGMLPLFPSKIFSLWKVLGVLHKVSFQVVPNSIVFVTCTPLNTVYPGSQIYHIS